MTQSLNSPWVACGAGTPRSALQKQQIALLLVHARRTLHDAADPASWGNLSARHGGESVIDVTPNIPEVVAEVRQLFERYEEALVSKNVDVLDATFWNSPHTLRYGVGEQLYGYDQIAAFRAGRDPGFVVDRDLLKLWIVTYGHDFGTANCEFRRHGQTKVGRQSHTWMRTKEGWRIVAAHVSLLGEATVMKK